MVAFFFRIASIKHGLAGAENVVPTGRGDTEGNDVMTRLREKEPTRVVEAIATTQAAHFVKQLKEPLL